MENHQAATLRARDVLARPFSSSLLHLICQGIVVGLITGLIVSVFRWLIDQTLKFLGVVYPFMGTHPWALIPYLLATLLVAGLLGRILKNDLTDLVGSGVPQIEAILLGKHSMNAWSVLWRKFVGGLLAICPGLFLGREGPCIQMGACVGQGLTAVFHTSSTEKKFLLGCGVAAGLSAAFSAPLAGVLFLLEEITFSFKPRGWVTALAASIAADYVTTFFFGAKPCLYLPLKANLPQGSYGWLIIFGIIIGALAFGYQYCLLNLHWWYGKAAKFPKYYHCAIPLLLVIPIGLWNAKILGGSHVFITVITQLKPTANWQSLIATLLIFLAVRFVFSMISYGASVPGGIFMPILVLGALIGAICAVLLIHAGLIPASCYLNMIVITMAAYFGAIEEAPFTAITLLTEMVGTVDQVLPMIILTFTAYVTSHLLGGRPIYAALREEMQF